MRFVNTSLSAFGEAVDRTLTMGTGWGGGTGELLLLVGTEAPWGSRMQLSRVAPSALCIWIGGEFSVCLSR